MVLFHKNKMTETQVQDKTSSSSSKASRQEFRVPKETSTEHSHSEPRGILADIILNAVEPGTNQTVLIFLNLVFLLLLATLVGVSVFTGINIHIVILGIITIGLGLGFNL